MSPTDTNQLQEFSGVRQVPGESRRRWFEGGGLELIVWEDDAGVMTGFQLCYSDQGIAGAMTWNGGPGISHDRIDDGEGRVARSKMLPLLTASSTGPPAILASRFANAARELDPILREFIGGMISA